MLLFEHFGTRILIKSDRILRLLYIFCFSFIYLFRMDFIKHLHFWYSISILNNHIYPIIPYFDRVWQETLQIYSHLGPRHRFQAGHHMMSQTIKIQIAFLTASIFHNTFQSHLFIFNIVITFNMLESSRNTFEICFTNKAVELHIDGRSIMNPHCVHMRVLSFSHRNGCVQSTTVRTYNFYRSR